MELGELAGVYAEVLAKNLGRPVLVCDRESIVAATGTGKGQLLGRQISDAAARLLAMRGPTPRRKPLPAALRPLTKGKRCCCASAPLWCRGDVEGGVLLTGRPQDAAPDAETARAVNIAAAFFSKVDGRMNRWPVSPCCLAGSKTKGNTAQFPPYGLSTASAAAARHLRCQNAR